MGEAVKEKATLYKGSKYWWHDINPSESAASLLKQISQIPSLHNIIPPMWSERFHKPQRSERFHKP